MVCPGWFVLPLTSPGSNGNFQVLNLMVPPSTIGTTVVDGVPVAATNFVAMGNSGYYGAQIPGGQASHTVNSSQPVEVQVYGFGYEDELDAYGYFGGAVNSP